MSFTIECQKRAPGTKPNALRQAGLIPAVLYGHNGTESLELTIPTKAAEFLVRDAAVKRSIIEVKVTDAELVTNAVLQEVQAHPWKNSLYHLSFLATAQG
jgi:large subunit ribosomal protein L25